MKRKQVFTPKMKEFQIDLLHKEIKRLRGKLSKQLGLFEDLLRTAEIDTVRRELSTGSEILSELKSTVLRYINVCNQGEVDSSDVAIMLEAEEDSFNKIVKAVNEWIDMKESTEAEKQRHIADLKRDKVQKDAIEGRESNNNMRITINLMRVHGKLENQLRLFDDLFLSKDEVMIKTELKRLLEIFKEMKTISTSLSEHLCPIEKEKMENILAEAEHQVKKTRTSANEILFTIREEDKTTSISLRSRLSNLSKGTRPAIYKSIKKCPTVIGDYFDKQHTRTVMELENKPVMSHNKMKTLMKDYHNRENEQDNTSIKSFLSNISREQKVSHEKLSSIKNRWNGSDDSYKKIIEDIESHLTKFYKQNGLIKNLLLTNNLDMMNKEIKNLDKIYDRILIHTNNVNKDQINSHVDEISDKVHDIDNTMGETKRMVAKWMINQRESDRKSKRSHRSKDSKRSTSSRSGKSKEPKESGVSIEILKKQLNKNKERLYQQRTLVEESSCSSSSSRSSCSSSSSSSSS